ncbi:MAG: hypothetical protein EP330_01305 [Deltaproteobacteria bacterium]|nr:MAG: hypothetical protein EP330_01305 [Deltaproteobacteria bacterium]
MADAHVTGDEPSLAQEQARRWLLMASVSTVLVAGASMLAAGLLAGVGALAAHGTVPMGLSYWTARQLPAGVAFTAGVVAGGAALHGSGRWMHRAAWLLALALLLGVVSLAADVTRSNVLGVLLGLARLPLIALAWGALVRTGTLVGDSE